MMKSPDVGPENVGEIPKRLPSVVADRFVSYLSSLCDLMIQLELEFAERLDAERLAGAVDRTLDAEPILGCRFVEHWRRPYWERLGREERERAAFLVTEDEGQYEAFKTRSIDAHHGPQVQACLFRSAAGDCLLFKVAHVVADAGGVREIAALVSSIYARLAGEPGYRPEPNLKGSRGIWQVMRNVPWHVYPRIYLNFLRETFAQVVRRGVHALPVEDGPRTSLEFVRRRLPADRVTRLAEYGRARQATLNDMILAAFFRGLAVEGRWDGQSRLIVTTTVDLRRWHLPDARAGAIANLSAFEYPSLGTHLGDDFESTLEQVSSITRGRKTSWIGLHDWVGFLPLSILPHAWSGGLYRKIVGQAVKKRSLPLVFLTNLGAIQPESVTFGAPPLSARILPPPGRPPHFMAGLSGYAGSLTLSTGVYPNAKEIAERFFDQVLSQLPE